MIDYSTLDVTEDLRYKEKPVEVLPRKIKTLRTREIAFIKVWWGNQSAEEAT